MVNDERRVFIVNKPISCGRLVSYDLFWRPRVPFPTEQRAPDQRWTNPSFPDPMRRVDTCMISNNSVLLA